MTGALHSPVALAVGSVLVVAVAIAAHFAIVSGSHESTVGAWLALIPVAALAVWAVRRSRRPRTTLVGVGATIVTLWIGWPVLERNFPSLLFVEHAGANAVLAIVFGRTLLRNREALCTRFARTLHDTLPREVERYTRLVTLAWTIFFGAVFVLSCGLYLGGYLAAWSLLANILSPVLIAGMFLVEYLVRGRMLPDWERTGVLSGIRAFARHFATAQPEAPR